MPLFYRDVHDLFKSPGHPFPANVPFRLRPEGAPRWALRRMANEYGDVIVRQWAEALPLSDMQYEQTSLPCPPESGGVDVLRSGRS